MTTMEQQSLQFALQKILRILTNGFILQTINEILIDDAANNVLHSNSNIDCTLILIRHVYDSIWILLHERSL